MRALLLLTALLLGGCSLGTTVASQAGDYNLAVEQAANTQLLRNVLRARDQMPLHYTTVPQIRGSLSIGLGQPGIGIPISGSQQGFNLGLSGSSSPSFDVSALDTQEFTRGLLEPLEPELFRYYLERGYSEQMLLLLFFGSVVEGEGGKRLLNDPRCWFRRPDCPEPADSAAIERAFLTNAANGRYEFHDYTSLVPVGPPLTQAQATDAGLLAMLNDGKMRVLPLTGGRFQLYRAEPRFAACRWVMRNGRMVLRPLLGVGAGGTAPGNTCESHEVVERPASLAGGGNEHGVQIQLRSVADIIRFLGLVLKVQEELELDEGEKSRCLAFQPAHAVGDAGPREACLFRLARGRHEELPAGVALMLDHDGVRYRVPRFAEPAANGSQRGDYTTQVLALLTELMNLKKSSSAIPATRAVRILR